MSEMLTVDEVAERLSVSHGTVRSLIREGELMASRIRRQLRVTEEQLSEYLNKAKVVSDE
jgi:putative molybdopterin biosynthesis protein